MAAMWLITVSSFVEMMNDPDQHLDRRYPYFAVLLYAPMNGLEGRVHDYTVSHWGMLNSLTGDNCLMMALAETPATTVEDFTPGDIYQIARLLGVDVERLPYIVFFTDPKQRRDTLVLSLANFFSAADDATDDRLTKWFRSVQSVIDACVGEALTTNSSAYATGSISTSRVMRSGSRAASRQPASRCRR